MVIAAVSSSADLMYWDHNYLNAQIILFLSLFF
jgi:hypothetical protein